MALELKYQTIAEQYKSRKPLAGNTSTAPESVTINVPQLQPINLPMADIAFVSGVKTTPRAVDEGLTELGLKRLNGGIQNNSSKPTALINADRVIINSAVDYTILAGQAGIAITSPNSINMDSDSSITLFGMNNLYLGVPGKGTPRPPSNNPIKPQKKSADGKTLKVSPTKDFDYEPLVLGLKLTNWLDDLLQVLKNAALLTPVGIGYFREDTQYDMIGLQARLKEMISTYAFIDGYSHELVDVSSVGNPPTEVTTPSPNIVGVTTGGVSVDAPTSNTKSVVQDNLSKLPGYKETNKLNIKTNYE